MACNWLMMRFGSFGRVGLREGLLLVTDKTTAERLIRPFNLVFTSEFSYRTVKIVPITIIFSILFSDDTSSKPTRLHTNKRSSKNVGCSKLKWVFPKCEIPSKSCIFYWVKRMFRYNLRIPDCRRTMHRVIPG